MTSGHMILIYIGAIVVTYIILKLIGFEVDSEDPWDSIGVRLVFSLFTGVTLIIIFAIYLFAFIGKLFKDNEPPRWL